MGRKNTSGNAKKAAIGLIFVLLIILGDIIAAAVSTSPLSVCPTSPSSPCLTQVQSAPSAGSTCVLTSATSVNCPITFSPAYSSIPSMTWGATPSLFSPGNGFGFVNVPSGSIVFFSVESTGQTWLNMPSAVTEIFGDNSQHWVWVDWSGITSNIIGTWQVSCPTASNTALAYLTLQFSTDNGVTWKYLDSGTTTDNVALNHIIIDGANNVQGNCGTGSAPAVSNQGLAANFVASPAARNKEYLRIVGAFGGGVGDSPVFVSAQINLFTASPILCVPGATVTSTTLNLSIRCSAATSVTFLFRWRVGILA